MSTLLILRGDWFLFLHPAPCTQHQPQPASRLQSLAGRPARVHVNKWPTSKHAALLEYPLLIGSVEAFEEVSKGLCVHDFADQFIARVMIHILSSFRD
ncbi:hypothetical protein EV126DRAFT_425324 [Verticillium dahliae]|nr:hypothetical protein EV126DRAFT_425324 [Verticillium dahliae]